MLAYIVLLIVVLWRLALPHPLSFTPLLACLLFFGASAKRKFFWLPALLVAGTDLLLNARYGYKVTPDFYVTWLWYAGMVWLGSALKEKQTPLRVAAAAVGGSLSFFFISNFMVWMVWNMYPKTAAGLAACYAAGVPFYRNQFAGDMIFTAAVFGIPALVKMMGREDAVNIRPA